MQQELELFNEKDQTVASRNNTFKTQQSKAEEAVQVFIKPDLLFFCNTTQARTGNV